MRPSSRVRIRASRLNGALSRGPVTEAGKRRSAANAIYHGLYSKQVVLPNESQKAFDKLIEQHVDHLQPRYIRELALVHDIDVTRWRLRRLNSLEQQILDANLPPKHYVWTETHPEPTTPSGALLDPNLLTIDTRGIEDRLNDAHISLLSHRKLQTLQNHRFRQQNLYHRYLARFLALQDPKKQDQERKIKNGATQPS